MPRADQTVADPPGRPRRADAERNARRVIEAARDLFAERGAAATVPEIARRAGVGKATVYRNYPTKSDLIAAVSEHRMIWLRARVLAALEEPDAWVGVCRVVLGALAHARTDRMLGSALGELFVPDPRGVSAEVNALMETLMRRAKDQGRMRPDATPADLRLLISGVSHALVRTGDDTPARWERAAELIVHAVRADR